MREPQEWGILYLKDYGQPYILEAIDPQTNDVADLSAYDKCQQIELFPPHDTSHIVAAAFDSDGSDGRIRYIRGQNDIKKLGIWEARGIVQADDAHLTIGQTTFKVKA